MKELKSWKGLYVEVGDVRKPKSHKARLGFEKTKFEKQTFVTITLTDHSEGHGVVKSVNLQNPSARFLLEISNDEFWNVEKNEVQVILDSGETVKRTFRTVYLLVGDREILMSNPVNAQIRNLAKNAKINVNGEQHSIVGYVNEKGEVVDL